MGNGASLEPGTHRQLAVDLFNRTWELLDKKARSDHENDEMLIAAFASLHHWHQIGDAKNHSVGNWQVSRVAAVLGYPELAGDYGRRSLEVASASDLGPFYIAYGHEALARAARLAGNRKDVVRHLALATEMLGQITDPAERTLLNGDLAELGPE